MVQPDTRPSGHPERRGTPALLYAAVAAPVMVAILAAATQPWLRPSDLTRDSQAVAVAHDATSPAYGVLSNVGIVLMAVACGMALLGWLVSRQTGDPVAALLAWSSALGLAFVLDDLLLLHESAAFGPWAGIAAAATYAAGFVAYLARFHELIRARLDGGLLILALAAFAGSAVVDVLAAPTQASVLVEDGAKLLGIVAWSVFVGRAAITALASNPPASTSAERVEPSVATPPSPGARAGAGAQARTR
ncbi:multidrug transporter EmrE-like cation transporter [Agromyces flavus]|nr:hypothetical protein [Agromyces flavus]MCP2367312.1 multidrug transporter EmrE-like cation transporter [Agromyces flavus]GGI45979.1 hypothetical protein GCM10010932_12290 [Agromyces flavus]